MFLLFGVYCCRTNRMAINRHGPQALWFQLRHIAFATGRHPYDPCCTLLGRPKDIVTGPGVIGRPLRAILVVHHLPAPETALICLPVTCGRGFMTARITEGLFKILANGFRTHQKLVNTICTGAFLPACFLPGGSRDRCCEEYDHKRQQRSVDAQDHWRNPVCGMPELCNTCHSGGSDGR